MWPVHGVDVSTLWKSGCLNFLEPSGSVQGVLYLLSHISGYKLMKHPTFQLSGFSCIVLADRAVIIFAVKKTEGDYSACQNTWNNSSTRHWLNPKSCTQKTLDTGSKPQNKFTKASLLFTTQCNWSPLQHQPSYKAIYSFTELQSLSEAVTFTRWDPKVLRQVL
jgi:hypothetical protein